MKKLFLVLLGAVAIVSAYAQDIRMNAPPDTVTVKAVGVRSISNNDNSWRVGLGFPVLQFRDRNTLNASPNATADLWVLTDARDVRTPYLGGGLDFRVYERKHMRLGFTAGWSGDFSDLEHVKSSRWSVGASLAFKI